VVLCLDTSLELVALLLGSGVRSRDALAEKMQPVLDTYAGQAQLADRFVRQVKR
jgi:hypothetical protein